MARSTSGNQYGARKIQDASAVIDALKPFGVQHQDMPLARTYLACHRQRSLKQRLVEGFLCSLKNRKHQPISGRAFPHGAPAAQLTRVCAIGREEDGNEI
jgi:hypothetical protein